MFYDNIYRATVAVHWYVVGRFDRPFVTHSVVRERRTQIFKLKTTAACPFLNSIIRKENRLKS